MKHVLLLTALLLVGCASNETDQKAPRMGEGAEVGPGGEALAPYPFTPEQLRATYKDGTELIFRVSVLGQPAVIQRMQFGGADAEGVTVLVKQESVEGIPGRDLMNKRSTWKELQEHARFSAVGTARFRERVRTSGAEWDCWVYVVAGPEGSTTSFSFADLLPGPPVLLEQSKDGETILRMELIDIITPGGDLPSH